MSNAGVSQYVTADQVETTLGLPAQSLSPIAWLVMQEEAAGVERIAICKNLGVERSDLEALIDSTTGKTGQESADLWQQGVIAIRAVTIVNQQNISSGWDAIEALAVDKIARNLSAMKGPGDIDRMMALASLANKAVRRGAGESNQRGGASVGASNQSVTVELNSGALGTIRLNLSPAIQQQLSRPNRVIDAVRNRDKELDRTNTDKLEMLNLKDTRELVEAPEMPEAESEGRVIKEGNTRYYPPNRKTAKLDPASLSAEQLEVPIPKTLPVLDSKNE